MTPEQVASVRATLVAIDPDLPALTRAFYRRLFDASPELRELFPADLATQEAKFAAELAQIGSLLDRVDDLAAHTAELGRRHVAYGVRAAHYDVVRDALLAVIAEHLGPALTDDDRAAWRRMYHLVATAMQLPH